MKPTVILYTLLPDELCQRLGEVFNVVTVPDLSEGSIQQQQASFKTAIGIIGTGGVINSTLLAKMPALRFCSIISAGYDSIDVQALTQHKVLLTNTPGALTETVADIMMALVLNSARNIPAMDHWVKTGEWEKSQQEVPLTQDVHHKKMGIIGMGRIGLALARRAHLGFSMEIIYHNRKPHPEAAAQVNARWASLEETLSESDCVCVVLPLTPETRHLISTPQLALMKPSAILINAGRGPVVDEQALIHALEQKVIYGAGLDVFEQEPLPASSALTRLANVVTLPHIGSATHETRYAMKRDGVDNLIQAYAGTLTENKINPEVLD